ncbi:MAG: thioredoxin family protein [Bacteroidota bacterium]|jgi:thioredoxin-related protein
MKKLILFFLIALSLDSFAQDSLIYHPELNAAEQIKSAKLKASAENKHVLLMIGGNWCKWCRMFNKFVTTDTQLDSAMNKNFVVEHINYSKENKNEDVLKSLQFPQRFGYPVFVILNSKGELIHTQNSAYLEKGEGYSKEIVMDFFHQWRKDALDEKNYKK